MNAIKVFGVPSRYPQEWLPDISMRLKEAIGQIAGLHLSAQEIAVYFVADMSIYCDQITIDFDLFEVLGPPRELLSVASMALAEAMRHFFGTVKIVVAVRLVPGNQSFISLGPETPETGGYTRICNICAHKMVEKENRSFFCPNCKRTLSPTLCSHLYA